MDCAGEALDPSDAPFGTAPQSTQAFYPFTSDAGRLPDTCLNLALPRFAGRPLKTARSDRAGAEPGSVREAAGVGLQGRPAYGATVEPSLLTSKQYQLS